MPNENKQNACVGKAIYINLKYTRFFFCKNVQLYILITIELLPGMGEEGNGSGFRIKEEERGRREREDMTNISIRKSHFDRAQGFMRTNNRNMQRKGGGE